MRFSIKLYFNYQRELEMEIDFLNKLKETRIIHLSKLKLELCKKNYKQMAGLDYSRRQIYQYGTNNCLISSSDQ